jgi:4-hydroxy-tetrahydrodipicolinate synthase
MTDYKKFEGTGVAIVTPFHKNGSIDFTSFTKLIEYLLGGGVDYLVVMGTTGEVATLTKDEKNAVLHFVIEQVNKRVPVVLGIGGNNTLEVVSQVSNTSFDGVDALLSISPYYVKPQQKGIFQHFRNIAAESPVPMIIYNVPGRTGSNITSQTTLKIAHEIKNIIGIKEASGNMMQCMEILKDKPGNFLFISGEDALTFPLMALGAAGVISVVANAFPADMSEMVHLCLKGEFEKAAKIHFRLLDFTNAMFADGSPSGVKAALEIMGIIQNNLRLPLVKVDNTLYNHISGLIESMKKKI